MTDPLREEEKPEKSEEKSEKEIERIDKEFLSKAKDSRDLIDKKLRTFENSIEDISDTIKNGEDDEKREIEKKPIDEISDEISQAQENLDLVQKKIDDKEEYLTALEETINALEDRYNRKNEEMQNLEERLEIVTESKETLDEEYKELLKNNEQLVKSFETRQVDLIVLTDSVKEKVSVQDDLRNKITKLNQEINEKEQYIFQIHISNND